MIKIKRKIVQHGNTSLTVSLPIKWAKKFNLNKGDEIDVEEQNNSLIISTEKSFKIDVQEVNTKNLDKKTLNWLLSALYKRGHDEIKIFFEDPSHMQIIQNRVNQLMGYAIIEQTHNSCVIKNISEALKDEFDSTLKRAFLLTISMGDGVFDVMSDGKDMMRLQGLISMEETNNQLTGFCHRIINKQGYKEFQRTSFVYVVIWLLESIADEYRDICKFYIKDENCNLKLSKDSIEVFRITNDMVSKFYDTFYDFSYEKILEIARMKKDVRERTDKMLMKNITSEVILLKKLDAVAHCVSDSIGSLLGLNG